VTWCLVLAGDDTLIASLDVAVQRPLQPPSTVWRVLKTCLRPLAAVVSSCPSEASDVYFKALASFDYRDGEYSYCVRSYGVSRNIRSFHNADGYKINSVLAKFISDDQSCQC
jgi:hypothetical protein